MGEVRYRVEWRDYTMLQRCRLWLRGVIDAIRQRPDTRHGIYVEVREGEFGYDQAPFVQRYDEYPLRFKFENGQYVRVNPYPESHEPNPEWQ